MRPRAPLRLQVTSVPITSTLCRTASRPAGNRATKVPPAVTPGQHPSRKGHTHPGSQTQIPSAGSQLSRNPPGATASVPGWQAQSRMPHTREPTSSWTGPPPGNGPCETIRSRDPHLEDPDGSKGGKLSAPQSRKPDARPSRVTTSAAHGVDQVFPNVPRVGRNSPRAAGRAKLFTPEERNGLATHVRTSKPTGCLRRAGSQVSASPASGR